MDYQIDIAEINDIQKILELQKLSFKDVAAFYDDYSLPPLMQTYDEILKEFKQKLFLKLTVESQIIGSVRGFLDGNNACQVERLIVHPDWHNQGFGRLLIHELESHFPECSYFELFTGEESENTLHLYKKLGYSECSKKNAGHYNIIYLRKPNDHNE